MNAFAGNEKIKKIIARCANERAFSHAYIISGPKGSGKKTIASFLAGAILCENADTRPCGVCPHCRKAAAGIHPDLFVAESEGREFVVAQARDIRSDVYTRPNEASYKVYIIHDAHYMNRNAQNALLKVLEEPPSYAVFILLSDDADLLLETVCSRCVILKTAPVGADDALVFLRERFRDREEDELMEAVIRSGGILGVGIEFLEGRTVYEGGAAIPFLKAIASGDELKIFEAASDMGRLKREDLKIFLDTLLYYLHLSIRLSAGFSSGHDENIPEECVLLSDSLTNTEILHTIEKVRKARENCDFNAGPAHIAGALAVLCWEASH